MDVISAFAAKHEATPAQVALAWLLAKKPWIVPIPGTAKLSRREENLGAAQVKLTADDVRSLEEASSKIKLEGARYPEAHQKLVGAEPRRTSMKALQLFLVAVVLTVTGVQEQSRPATSDRDALIGAWHLVRIDAPGADPKVPLTPQPEGMVDSRATVYVCTTDVSKSANSPDNSMCWVDMRPLSAAMTSMKPAHRYASCARFGYTGSSRWQRPAPCL